MSLFCTDKEELENSHHPSAIEERLEAKKKFSYLGDAVLGAIDGCVTTFAVVSGVLGGKLSPSVAILLGVANLLADGFSMAVGNYQRAKSERELIEKVKRVEEKHIEQIPEGEREEVYQIYKKKGFPEPLVKKMTEVITRDKKLWLNTMLVEEFGLQLEGPIPWKASLATFLAFVFVGSIPLLPFLLFHLLSERETFFASALMTGIAFFCIGLLKGRILKYSPLRSGLETLLMGTCAAGLAYGVGVWLRGFLS